MVTTSFINRLSHAVDVLENRSQQGRPWKVVQIPRGYDEHPDAALDRHYAAHPEDRGADVVIWHFLRRREKPTRAKIWTRRWVRPVNICLDCYCSARQIVASPHSYSRANSAIVSPAVYARQHACAGCDRVQLAGRTSCPFVWPAGSRLHTACGSGRARTRQYRPLSSSPVCRRRSWCRTSSHRARQSRNHLLQFMQDILQVTA